jgi:hypothetical protein
MPKQSPWRTNTKERRERQGRFSTNVDQVGCFLASSHTCDTVSLVLGIDSLFKKIGCDRGQIDHMLQSHEGVTEDNILRYFGIIEERTNELLTAQAVIAAKVNDYFSKDLFENVQSSGTKHSLA